MPDLAGYKAKYERIGDRFYQEVFVSQIYEPLINKKADVVLDVGALAGEFSFWIYPNAKVVYAIEPEMEAFLELVGNIKEFGFDNVVACNFALGGGDGEGQLALKGRGGNTLKSSQSTSQTVKIKTLASFMKEKNIDKVDILKIDIEDGEEDVFKAPDFKEVAGKIGCIMGEHLGNLEGYLTDLGFKAETYERDILFEKV